MKQLLLLIFFAMALSPAFAQIDACLPDSSYLDSTALIPVFPPPYEPTTSPNGGIQDSACLNKTFKYVFTAIVPDTISFSGNTLNLDSLVLNTDEAEGSLGIENLPDGMYWGCNPPNCRFEPNTIACVGIYGTVSDEAFLGDNELQINVKVYTPGFQFDVPLPGPLPGTEGSYSLYVHPEDYPNCSVLLDDQEVPGTIEYVQNVPNPFSAYTTIEFGAKERASLQFTVMNLLGEVVETRTVDVFEGKNTLEFNGSKLPNGVYLYSFSDGRKVITKKMVLSR